MQSRQAGFVLCCLNNIHHHFYWIAAKGEPKRNTSWRRGRGEKKTQTKVGIPLSPSSSRFSSLDSLFPQPPPPHPLPTFTFFIFLNLTKWGTSVEGIPIVYAAYAMLRIIVVGAAFGGPLDILCYCKDCQRQPLQNNIYYQQNWFAWPLYDTAWQSKPPML